MKKKDQSYNLYYRKPWGLIAVALVSLMANLETVNANMLPPEAQHSAYSAS
jgi:hypothetical protein